MKLVWSPELASKAYIQTVRSCEVFQESGVAELISAMAAGWNAKLVVETWSRGGAIAVSIGLAVATRHTEGRHVCIVPDEESRAEYVERMSRSGYAANEMVESKAAEEAIEGLGGIDFLVVDCRGDKFAGIIRGAILGQRGAVLVCKNASSRAASDFRWRSVMDGKARRVVRSVFLPVGDGLDIAHVGATDGGSGKAKGEKRWIKRVDRESGEEFAIRK